MLAALSSPVVSHADAGDIDPTTDPAVQITGDPVEGDYVLAWSDEFAGDEVDRDKWDYRTDSKLWSTQLPENVSVSGGVCRIALRKETSKGKDYTGGGLISTRKFRHGFYEARIKVPPTEGWHTSFWMMEPDLAALESTHIELDPLENDSIDLNSYSVAIHQWRSDIGHVRRWHRVHRDESLDEFQVYGLEYTNEATHFYFNGELVRTVDVMNEVVDKKNNPSSTEPRKRKVSEVTHNDVSIWFTSIAAALGGTERIDESSLPVEAACDYVRFFAPVTGDW